MEEKIQCARQWLADADRIAFFGGAGVSTASGIPDFRSATGLYNRKNETGYSPEYMLSHEFFMKDAQKFQDFCREALIYPEARPNEAHKALKKLEDDGHHVSVITQNIDGLHQMAGSSEVIEIHGNLRDYYCVRCGKRYSLAEFMKAQSPVHCSCGGTVRPDVTLYGEMLPEKAVSRAIKRIREADLLIVGGTSLVVYPAAGFVREFRGKHTIVINAEATMLDRDADLVFHEDIGSVLKRICE